ncbi:MULTISPECIES: virB8 family protein [Phyllobacteriaceae]|uniref:virB8 family protein n=1 Tax=Phyllobacteriaceae TaxID=69277 RepID=UPI002ACA00C5|nr:type IV secretion system protein [Chelativorans sp. M5D2P16]MDZ5695727.1 type IV secretion system protein [Chelativorans sp. M5D2P16]
MSAGPDELRTYYQDGVCWEAEIIKKAKRSRALAWFVTTIFGAVALISLTVLLMLVPLKSFEPYIVEVDTNTGYVEVKSGLTRPLNLTEEKAVTQANIVRYVRAREGYDPYRISDNYRLAALLSTARAAKDLQSLYSSGNPKNPKRIYGDSTEVLVRIKSVNFPNDTTAIVRFSTEERTSVDSLTRHYASVVRFRYTDTPTANKWRFENPLGFQVYHYRREQETVSPEAG